VDFEYRGARNRALACTPSTRNGSWERKRKDMHKNALRYCGVLSSLLGPLLIQACQDSSKVCELSADEPGGELCYEIGDFGRSTLAITIPEPAGANCPEGGKRIDTGFDDNDNGLLDANEVEASAYICDGVDGRLGPTGPAGPTGVAGPTGLSALSTLSPEEPGDACPEGGIRIDFGTDVDHDGTLQEDEVAGTRYLCDGETGVQGASGTTGIGATGAQGDDGAEGVAGPQGDGSLIRVTSFDGDANGCGEGGIAVAVGVDNGADGLIGGAIPNDGTLQEDEVSDTDYLCNLVGATGIAGIPGDDGALGPQGTHGDIGAQGSQGNDGVQGPQGSQGTQGNDGLQGPQGSQGDSGSQGPQGAQGNLGPQGAQGPQGDSGSQGAQGVQGDSGSQGAQGVQGDPGTQGAQGPQGDLGPQGATGIAG
jgi:collagen triple helix repeat protein